MVGDYNDLPTIQFVEGIRERRDSMLATLLHRQVHTLEDIRVSLNDLRWRVVCGKSYSDAGLTPREQARFVGGQLIEDDLMGWKIRAVLSVDRRYLYVTMIEQPAAEVDRREITDD